MPRFSRQKLHALSRNRTFLVRLCLTILATFAIVALTVSSILRTQSIRHLDPDTYRSKPRLIDSLEETITDPKTTPDQLAAQIRALPSISRQLFTIAGDLDASDRQLNRVTDFLEDFDLTHLLDLIARAPSLDPSQRSLFDARLKSLFGADEEKSEARDYLVTHADMHPPIRFANEFAADLLYHDGDLERALDHYRIEAKLPDTDYARGQVVSLLLTLDRHDELHALLEDESYRQSLTPHQKIEIAVKQKDWKAIARAVIAFDYRLSANTERFVAVFAAAIWFLILFQFTRFSWSRLGIYLAAIVAGIFSATATLVAVILQERLGGMNTGNDWLEQTIYFVVGVGVREELIKLALFLPFLPILLIRRQPAEALLTAACVGLGFALQENVGYYVRSGTAEAIGRFITANFLHLSLTGLLGFALYNMIRKPARYWEEFLATLIGAIVLHGAYDAFIAVDEFAEYSIFAIFIFVALAWRFFGQLEQVREHRSVLISPLAVFLVGLSILIGITMIDAMVQSPLRTAFLQIATAFLGAVPIAFVFINQFKRE